jgi:hypothetical protein
MLNVGSTLGSSGASLSLDTRVAVGAGVFVVSPAESSAPVSDAPLVDDQKIPAYNAFQFSYRSDFGKVILLQQNVETGQEVTQVPTEYHLRQYAATQRAQRIQLQQKLYKSSGAEQAGQGQSAPRTVVVAKTSAAPSGPSAPAASQPAAPSVAPSTVAAAAVAHVDIKA